MDKHYDTAPAGERRKTTSVKDKKQCVNICVQGFTNWVKLRIILEGYTQL